MKGSKIRIVVVGVGYRDTKLVNEYLTLSESSGDFEIYGMVDFASEKLEEIQDKFKSYNLRSLDEELNHVCCRGYIPENVVTTN